jgi:hypothetical protein
MPSTNEHLTERLIEHLTEHFTERRSVWVLDNLHNHLRPIASYPLMGGACKKIVALDFRLRLKRKW